MFKNLYSKYKASDVVGKYIFANVFVYVFLLLIGIFFGAVQGWGHLGTDSVVP